MKIKIVTKKVVQLVAISSLLFWQGCQTLPKIENPEFSAFQIQKITSKGIETVTVKPSSSAWPDFTKDSATSFNTSSKNLRLAVIGDTGCRLKESKNGKSYQDCSLTKEWPYSQVVDSIAKEDYNFGIHTGDYHYREQCTDAKLCPKFGKYIGYVWGAWWDDFYGPSQPLFKKPWMFVRGNHEDCNRAYLGWAALSPVESTKKFTDPCVVAEPYQWTELEDIVFINFDNAMMEDRKELKKEEAAVWNERFVEIKNRIQALKGKKEIWFLSHKPMFGYIPNEEDAEPKAIGTYMSDLLKSSGLYDQIDFFLAGHIHAQQVIPLPNKVQLVVAHSGTSLDPFGRKIMTEKFKTTTDNKYSFGYAIFEKTGFKKWTFLFKDTKGDVQLTCHSASNKVTCD